jgi:hypothetical protein
VSVEPLFPTNDEGVTAFINWLYDNGFDLSHGSGVLVTEPRAHVIASMYEADDDV